MSIPGFCTNNYLFFLHEVAKILYILMIPVFFYSVAFYTMLKSALKLKLPVLAGPLLAVQLFCHPLTLTSPVHWTTLGN